MLANPRFKAELDRSYTVNRDYDIPFVAGYSTDERTIYIDRHYKKMMGKFDTEPTIILHEKVEKSLIDCFGLRYQSAHHIATHVERDAIRAMGIDWTEYENFVERQYKIIGHEQVRKVPRKLDLTPYRDDSSIEMVRAMTAAMD